METLANATISNETRTEIYNYAKQLLHDDYFHNVMANISLLEIENKYKNWYMGYDMIELPMFAYGNNLDYTVKTLASKGKITTKYFRRKFNKEKLTNNIRFFINIGTPKVARLNENYTVQFNIEKNSLRKTNNRESIYMMDTFLEADIDNYTFTLNRPKEERFFYY